MRTGKNNAITTALLAALPVFALAAPAIGATEPKPEAAPDDTWLTIEGTVVRAMPEAFLLDYGQGVMTVEMDDFDFYGEGRNLMENDEVTVYGRVDDDLLEKRTIEASSVYVENLNTTFFASAVDEEDYAAMAIAPTVDVDNAYEVTGTVTSVSGREFMIDTGPSRIQVDTMALGYNPMDEDGFLEVEVGDRVKVGGVIDDDLFDEAELSANWIMELRD